MTKKEDSRSSTGELGYVPKEEAPTTATFKISIADFLDIVNSTHRSILSDDVLKHFHETRPTDGYYTGKVLFSEREDIAGEDGSQKNRRVKGAFTPAEIQAIQSIGRKSINSFTSADIKATEKFARRYWQEMGKKSPFFRAWFGDWRVNDHSLVQVADQIDNARGVQRNEDTGWDIKVSGKVFDETNNHKSIVSREARQYLPYINDIVRKAVLLDSFGQGKTKSENSLLMHSLYTVADIGNGPEILKLYVEEMNDPNSDNTTKRSYQLQNIEKAFAASGRVQGNAPSSVTNTANTIRTVADLFAAVKRMDTNFIPNSPSKIVNADGTPKVMYHGTPSENGEFYVFDESKSVKKGGLGFKALGKGNYFTAKQLDGTERYGSRVLSVYLNIRKPFVYKGGESFLTQAANALGLKADGLSYDDLQQQMRKRGYDGVLEYDKNGDVLLAVAFDSNQIKSATDNIGTFDGSNPDILLQDRPEESVSNRSLLANALESTAKDDTERKKIQEYKEKIDLLNAEEQKLQDLNAQVKELSFAKGPRDKAKIRALRDEAVKTANRINTYDRMLLRLEASSVLQNVLEREKKAA